MSEQSPSTELYTAASPVSGVVVGAVHGEVDLHNSPSLRLHIMESLKRWKPTRLILNLAKVPYFDSSAIAVLVEALKEIRKVGGKVFLTDLQPRVKGLLEIARLDSIFVIAKDEA